MIGDRTVKNNSYLTWNKYNFEYKIAYMKDTYWYNGSYDAWYWLKDPDEHITSKGYYIF